MGVESTVSKEGRQEVSFTVLAIDCILCSPLLRRSLAKIEGVLEFKELPFTNKIIVAFDPSRLEREALIQEITKISQRAGLGGKTVFHR